MIRHDDGADPMTLTGTAGDDVFEFIAGATLSTSVVKVNGVTAGVDPSAVGVSFDGLAGHDAVFLTGTDGNETAALWPDYGIFRGNRFVVTVANVASISVDGLGGVNVAKLYDSPGDDNFVAAKRYGKLYGEGFIVEASSFTAIHAYAVAGGVDVARLYDSPGDDRFTGTWQDGAMFGDGFYNRAKFFEAVHAYATAGGVDEAKLRDSPGDDVFFASPVEASLYGDGFYNRAKHFESVTASAAAGGTDEAKFVDSPGDDQFVATPTYAALHGDGFYNRARYFDAVHAYATSGTDVAKLYDSPGDDQFVATPTYAALHGDGFYNRARYFDAVHAYATSGADVAKLYDSSGDDTFHATPTEGALFGSNFYNRAKHFGAVHAYATAGGADRAELLDSPGDDNTFGSPVEASLYGEGFYNRAKGFERVRARATDAGYDTVRIHGSDDDDVLEATAKQVALFRLGHFRYQAERFEEVFADARGGERDRAVLFDLPDAGRQGLWTGYADDPATVSYWLAGFEDIRRPLVQPADYQENFGVAATFGLDQIEAVLREEDSVIVPFDQLETEGFSIDLFTARRWPHVRRDDPNGSVWIRAPRPGRYHVGFTMYDDAHDERVAFYVDGEFYGVAVARQDNNRNWLYWLEEPYEFRGGEVVELRGLGSDGKHGISNIVFLPRPPEVRSIEYRAENVIAATYVDQPGRVVLSWTTTWPCPTRFEYGRDRDYGTLIENETDSLVHRVVLEGLDPTVTFHGRPIGSDRDGEPFYGDDFVFRAAPPVVPRTVAGMHEVPLAVPNPHPFAVEDWPISTGIPFPQGQLGSIDRLRLVRDGAEVPAQFRIIARWPDASIKSVLLTFLANAPGGGQSRYGVQYGRDVRRAAVQEGLLLQEDDDGVAIDTGVLRFRIDVHGNLTDFQRGQQRFFQGSSTSRTFAVGVDGLQYDTSRGNAEITVEEAGPLRVVVKVVSHLTNPNGRRLLRVEKRVEAYRGAAWVRIYHTFVVDRPEKFTNLLELSFRVPVTAIDNTWRVPLADGTVVQLGDAVRTVRQRFDDELVTVSGNLFTKTPRVLLGERGRIIGAIDAAGEDVVAVAVRDFWQNYPKAFTVGEEGLDVGLCPPFTAGLYDRFPLESQQHLYYALLEGHYRLKQGMSKTHELLLNFESQERRKPVSSLFQQPPMAIAEPEWYSDSKVFYDVAPRDPANYRQYEEAVDANLEAYVNRREQQHDYGMLNYGDWYGERGSNWGNAEYDTQHAFFLQYIRSGNPETFLLAEAAELHNRDVDTVQGSQDPRNTGAVYVHQMNHVGEYYNQSVPGTLGFPRGGFTVSHAWVEGHFDHWYLTGDRRSFETGLKVADFFTREQLGRPYDFSDSRTPGWHLTMLVAAYHATSDPYYLNAARLVVERVLETQEMEPYPLPPRPEKERPEKERPEKERREEERAPYHAGGWPRMLMPDHCQDEPRHRGNVGFMVAILLSSLKYYHDLTGDPRVKESIIRGAHYMLDEFYSEEAGAFRYTSCPNTAYRPDVSPLMLEGIARAYRWTGDEHFRHVLTESLPFAAQLTGYGGEVSYYYRVGPRVLADLNSRSS